MVRRRHVIIKSSLMCAIEQIVSEQRRMICVGV